MISEGRRKKAQYVSIDGRSALVMPARSSAGGQAFAEDGLWCVSLDGFCVDALFATREKAVAGAVQMLEDPDCPMWIRTPDSIREQEIAAEGSALEHAVVSFLEAPTEMAYA